MLEQIFTILCYAFILVVVAALFVGAVITFIKTVASLWKEEKSKTKVVTEKELESPILRELAPKLRAKGWDGKVYVTTPRR